MKSTRKEILRRVLLGQRTIDRYYKGVNREDQRDALVDALTDLRHWAKHYEIDFHAAEQVSLEHHNTEQE
jgi:hypothetical protein